MAQDEIAVTVDVRTRPGMRPKISPHVARFLDDVTPPIPEGFF
jgi:hypothetical protein